MTYKGIEIDGTVLTCKADVDEHLKALAIEGFKNAVWFFCKNGGIDASIYADQRAEYLNTQCGMDWDEIEAIEIEVMKAA